MCVLAWLRECSWWHKWFLSLAPCHQTSSLVRHRLKKNKQTNTWSLMSYRITVGWPGKAHMNLQWWKSGYWFLPFRKNMYVQSSYTIHCTSSLCVLQFQNLGAVFLVLFYFYSAIIKYNLPFQTLLLCTPLIRINFVVGGHYIWSLSLNLSFMALVPPSISVCWQKT